MACKFFSRFANSGYVLHVHIHGLRDLGWGIDITSKVEALWYDIKSIIKKMYVSIPSAYLIFIIKEPESRKSIINISWIDIVKEFSILIDTLDNGNGINDDLYFRGWFVKFRLWYLFLIKLINLDNI